MKTKLNGIKKLRGMMGLTQQEFVDQLSDLSMNYNSLGRWERGLYPKQIYIALWIIKRGKENGLTVEDIFE